jgi:CHAT domain-containing protein
MKQILILLFWSVVMIPSVIYGQKRQKVGVESKIKYEQIKRINKVVEHLNKNEYNQIITVLKRDLIQADLYKKQHVLNEIADIYSYYLFDIEKAIEIDSKIRQIGLVTDRANYTLSKTGAHYGRKKDVKNATLSSVSYRDKYINVSSSKILSISQKRIDNNKELLNGNISEAKRYIINVIESGILKIKKDLEGAYQGTKDYDRLFSRLIRYEFEAFLTSGNTSYIKSYANFLNGKTTLNQIFFKEISFLKLSKYLSVAYDITKETKYLELAFLAINKPFLKMKKEMNKITFSVLVNKVIDDIVNAYYNKKDYPMFLFFSSLNKARVLAEETDSESFIFDSYAKLQRQKKKFSSFLKQKIQKHDYLDIYVQNSYSKEKVKLIPNYKDKKLIVSRDRIDTEKQNIIANNKDDNLIVNSKRRDGAYLLQDSIIFVPKPHAVYTTKILKDKIEIIKVDNEDLKYLIEETYRYNKYLLRRKETNEEWSDNTEHKTYRRTFVSTLELNSFISNLNMDTYISVNGAFANLPISYLLDKPTVRNLNMFKFSDPKSRKLLDVKEINILGLFNPNPIGERDLEFAEKEYTVIDSIFPKNNTILFKRDQVKKEILAQNFNKNINIFHFSGHGHNSKDPNKAGLEFIGKKQFLGRISDKENPGEYNLLSLSEMKTDRYKNIKNRDLVFLAACKVGVSRNNEKNDSEITGLIRPLLSNKNAVLSLWSVDDASTLEFVELFYSKLKNTGDIHYAFKESFEIMKKNNIDYINVYAPFYLINTGKDYLNFKL